MNGPERLPTVFMYLFILLRKWHSMAARRHAVVSCAQHYTKFKSTIHSLFVNYYFLKKVKLFFLHVALAVVIYKNYILLCSRAKYNVHLVLNFRT